MNGPPGVDVMVCEGCGQVAPWTPYGRCCWECYNLPRATPAEQQAALEAAPRAQTYFQALDAAAEARARQEAGEAREWGERQEPPEEPSDGWG